MREALLLFQEEDWVQAIEADGTVREGAFASRAHPDSWICRRGVRRHDSSCRRERPHPGAQLTFFDISEGYRHTCFITNVPTPSTFDVAVLELPPPRSRTSGGPDTHTGRTVG